jgi:hypothetical protein
LDTQLTQLGELYGETGLTRKLTPSEMVGQDVEVFWPFFLAQIFALSS